MLDTNTFSALMKGDPRVVDRLRALARTDVAVPEPVAAEIAYGLARLPVSKRRATLQARFQLLRGELPSVTWTSDVSDAFGVTKAALEKRGMRVDDFDVAVAAHALAHDATLVTSNGKHMRRIKGLRVEDWGSGV